jgi:CPA2 family monovalent cation:H+ antiporter-2
VLAVLALFVVCARSRRLLHGLLRWVASRDHEESFVLCSLCVVVASAAGAHAIGVSAALGAFLAGIVLGESDFRHRMEKHLRPFRDVLSGVFFVGIGSRLDFAQVVTTPGATMAWLLALVPIKIILNTLALRAACPRSMPAHRHSPWAWWRIRPVAARNRLTARPDRRFGGTTNAARAGVEHGTGPAVDPNA